MPEPLAEPLSFVVLTGLSGAGKSYAIKCFEDMGFFCVDNLPTTLIPTFADLTARSAQPPQRSALTVHQLKDLLIELYVPPKARHGLNPSLVSFGFKHGIPFDADLVFDVRFLPNPHFVKELRPLDGRTGPVREFVMKQALSREFLERLKDLLRFLLPCYEREGKAYLTVAIGCTGGRHRSVTFVEELRQFLEGIGFAPTVVHRDLDRE